MDPFSSVWLLTTPDYQGFNLRKRNQFQVLVISLYCRMKYKELNLSNLKWIADVFFIKVSKT